MDYQANTQSHIKLNNQKIILHLLINEGPMTRADLAKKMNTSKPTISKNVDDLISEKKIIEIGKDDNLVGKKGTLIDINANYGHVLSIDLSKNKVAFVLANLRKEWLIEKAYSLDALFEQGNMNLDIVDLLNHFMTAISVPLHSILMVSVAYPGVVGHNDAVYLTNLKFKESILSELTHYIKTELKLPMLIKNDVNLATLAEKRYGTYSDLANLYLLSADIGVGVGVVIHHTLYEGDRNAAGEVGFVLPIQRKDGRYYTLEERVSINALAKRYSDLTDKKVDYLQLKEDIAHGNTIANELYQDVLQDLSVAITNMASILDIKHIVVVGRLFDLSTTMLDDLNALVRLMTPFETVITKTFLEQMSLKGAISVGVEAIIETMI